MNATAVAPEYPPIDLTDPLVDAAVVAQKLGIKQRRVYELCRRPTNPLPCIKIGRATRFVLAHVERWVETQASV